MARGPNLACCLFLWFKFDWTRAMLILFFFLMWTILKVFVEFVTILLLFYILVFWLQGTWDLSFPTRDWTCTPCTGRQSLNHWSAREVPAMLVHFMHCLWRLSRCNGRAEYSWQRPNGLQSLKFLLSDYLQKVSNPYSRWPTSPTHHKSRFQPETMAQSNLDHLLLDGTADQDLNQNLTCTQCCLGSRSHSDLRTRAPVLFSGMERVSPLPNSPREIKAHWPLSMALGRGRKGRFQRQHWRLSQRVRGKLFLPKGQNIIKPRRQSSPTPPQQAPEQVT